MKDALENSAKCINYALNFANSSQKALIQKILKQLNQCRNSTNLNSNSNHEQQQDVDVEMQNANVAQSAQKAQKLHNEIATHNIEKVNSQNIEMRIEKTIDEKMKKVHWQLNQKLNQIMNLI